MRQADIMLEGEADAWLERNRNKLGKEDPVSDVMEKLGIVPKNVLEIGCSNGWRLAKLRDKYGCSILGVEPGRQACIEAAAKRVPVHQMTASTLPETDPHFDLVIYGFCLYLTDPKDWLTIAAEGDRVLQNDGYLIIHDFFEPNGLSTRQYEHDQRMKAYHFDFSKLWQAHPFYRVLRREIYGGDMVAVLKKASR